MCEIELKAHHEAAHGCLHFVFGHPVKELAISENGGYWKLVDGEERRYDPVHLAERESLLQDVICCCAGRAAMDRIFGYKAKDDTNWRASNDRAQAFEGCLEIADGDKVAAEHLLGYAMRRAEMLIEAHWPEIGRVAYGLLEHERLTGGQMREIIERTRAERL